MTNKIFTSIFFLLISLTITNAQDIEIPETQLSLISKKTATWCPNCGGAAWDSFKGMIQDNQEKAVMIAAHFSPSSDLYSGAALNIIDQFESYPGQPVFYFNEARVAGSGESTRTEIAGKVNTAFGQSPIAQTGLFAYYTPGGNSIEVKTETKAFENLDGTYYLGVYLVEKSVTADQSGRGNNVQHSNVLGSSFSNSAFGEILIDGNATQNSTFPKEYSIGIEEGTDKQNLQVVTILWKEISSGQFQFVNTNKTDEIVLDISAIRNEIPEVSHFQITPSPATSEATIYLQLEKALPDATITLFNHSGKHLRTLYQGKLIKGEQTFSITKNELPAGLYFVSLQSHGKTNTQKVIFH